MVAKAGTSLAGGALSSLWDGLSPHLLGKFSPMAKGGDGEWATTGGGGVVAAITEANLDVSLNWQSPFEQSGPESRAPFLMAMLQNGQIQPVVDALAKGASALTGGTVDLSGVGAELNGKLDQFEGRTGLTKLNSTQVFNGMPPLKIQLTALFRAWRDAKEEVEAPFNALMQMALPRKLAPDGSLLARLANEVAGGRDWVKALMPSMAPRPISFSYKSRTFAPMVIEHIGMPLSSNTDRSGNFVELLVPMTLCSLTALDRDDWQELSP